MKKNIRRINKNRTKTEVKTSRSFEKINTNNFDEEELQEELDEDELEEQYRENIHLITEEQEEFDEDKLEQQYRENRDFIKEEQEKSVSPVNLGSKNNQATDFGVIPHPDQSFKKDPLGLAIHELIHLENNPKYLSDEKLIRWGDMLKRTKKFERILIFLSIALNLPATKGLTQGQYFDKFFGWPDYVVSKTLKTVYTLMFLYCGVRSVEELENISDLQQIGDENDHTVSKYTDLISNHSEDHALEVFNMCNDLTAKKPSLKKVTATLVESVSETILQDKKLLESISDGASDEYSHAELSCINNSAEVRTSEHGDVQKDTDKIEALVSSLNVDRNHVQDIVNDRENYDSEDLIVILDIIDDLNLLTKSLRKVA